MIFTGLFEGAHNSVKEGEGLFIEDSLDEYKGKFENFNFTGEITDHKTGTQYYGTTSKRSL